MSSGPACKRLHSRVLVDLLQVLAKLLGATGDSLSRLSGRSGGSRPGRTSAAGVGDGEAGRWSGRTSALPCSLSICLLRESRAPKTSVGGLLEPAGRVDCLQRRSSPSPLETRTTLTFAGTGCTIAALLAAEGAVLSTPSKSQSPAHTAHSNRPGTGRVTARRSGKGKAWPETLGKLRHQLPLELKSSDRCEHAKRHNRALTRSPSAQPDTERAADGPWSRWPARTGPTSRRRSWRR